MFLELILVWRMVFFLKFIEIAHRQKHLCDIVIMSVSPNYVIYPLVKKWMCGDFGFIVGSLRISQTS